MRSDNCAEIQRLLIVDRERQHHCLDRRVRLDLLLDRAEASGHIVFAGVSGQIDLGDDEPVVLRQGRGALALLGLG